MLEHAVVMSTAITVYVAVERLERHLAKSSEIQERESLLDQPINLDIHTRKVPADYRRVKHRASRLGGIYSRPDQGKPGLDGYVEFPDAPGRKAVLRFHMLLVSHSPGTSYFPHVQT